MAGILHIVKQIIPLWMIILLPLPQQGVAQLIDPAGGRAVLRCEKRVAKAEQAALDRFGKCLRRPGDGEACAERVNSRMTALLRPVCPDELVREHFTAPSFERFAADLLDRVVRRATEIYDGRMNDGRRRNLQVDGRALDADFRFARQTTATKNQCELADRRVELTGTGGACRQDRVAARLERREARYERSVARLGEPSRAASLARSLPMLIANATCEEQLALDVHISITRPLIQSRLDLIWAQQQSKISQLQIGRAITEIGAGFIRLWDLKHIKNPEKWPDFKLQMQSALAVGDFVNIVLDVPDDPLEEGFRVFADGTAACVESYVTKSPAPCLTFFGVEAIDKALILAQVIVELDTAQQLIEVMLIDEYLLLYFRLGSDPETVAEYVTDDPEASLQEIFASDEFHGFREWRFHWTLGDYEFRRLEKLLKDFKLVTENFAHGNFSRQFCGCDPYTHGDCPPDADGDRVADAVDLCPGSAFGARVDADGCSCDQLDCSQANPCLIGFCDTDTVTCRTLTPLPGLACDTNPCLVGQSCRDGMCVGGTPVPRECGDGCRSNGETCGEPGFPGCGAGMTCSASCTCTVSCENECSTSGETSCGNGAVRTCGDTDADVCLEWSPAAACEHGCCGDRCCDPPACTDECSVSGEVQCTGSGTRTCGEYDADPCLEWGPTNTCAYGCCGDACCPAPECGNDQIEAGEQCDGGSCCDPITCQYKPASTVCDSHAAFDTACPWGNSCGSNVGRRSRPRHCSGSSALCNGQLGSWSGWSVSQFCSDSQVCGGNSCVTSSACNPCGGAGEACCAGSCDNGLACSGGACVDDGCPAGIDGGGKMCRVVVEFSGGISTEPAPVKFRTPPIDTDINVLPEHFSTRASVSWGRLRVESTLVGPRPAGAWASSAYFSDLGPGRRIIRYRCTGEGIECTGGSGAGICDWQWRTYHANSPDHAMSCGFGRSNSTVEIDAIAVTD